MESVKASDLRKGDRVRLTYDLTVQEVPLSGGYLIAEERGRWYPLDQTLSSLVVLERAKPEKPPVGSVITGAELELIQWKAGTVVALNDRGAATRMLKRNGTWVTSDYSGEVVFSSNVPYKILYLPEESR